MGFTPQKSYFRYENRELADYLRYGQKDNWIGSVIKGVDRLIFGEDYWNRKDKKC